MTTGTASLSMGRSSARRGSTRPVNAPGSTTQVGRVKRGCSARPGSARSRSANSRKAASAIATPRELLDGRSEADSVIPQYPRAHGACPHLPLSSQLDSRLTTRFYFMLHILSMEYHRMLLGQRVAGGRDRLIEIYPLRGSMNAGWLWAPSQLRHRGLLRVLACRPSNLTQSWRYHDKKYAI